MVHEGAEVEGRRRRVKPLYVHNLFIIFFFVFFCFFFYYYYEVFIHFYMGTIVLHVCYYLPSSTRYP
jgi:hypothetical protein